MTLWNEHMFLGKLTRSIFGSLVVSLAIIVPAVAGEAIPISGFSVRDDQEGLCQGGALRAWANALNNIYTGSDSKTGNPVHPDTGQRNWIIYFNPDTGKFSDNGGKISPSFDVLVGLVRSEIKTTDIYDCPSYLFLDGFIKNMTSKYLEESTLILLNNFFSPSIIATNEPKAEMPTYRVALGPLEVVTPTLEGIADSSKPAHENLPSTIDAKLKLIDETVSSLLVKYQDSKIETIDISKSTPPLHWVEVIFFVIEIIFIISIFILLLYINRRISDVERLVKKSSSEFLMRIQDLYEYSSRAGDKTSLRIKKSIQEEMQNVNSLLYSIHGMVDGIERKSQNTHDMPPSLSFDEKVREVNQNSRSAHYVEDETARENDWDIVNKSYKRVMEDPSYGEEFVREFNVVSMDNPTPDIESFCLSAQQSSKLEPRCIWFVPFLENLATGKTEYYVILSAHTYERGVKYLSSLNTISQRFGVLFDLEEGPEFELVPAKLSFNAINLEPQLMRGKIIYRPV